MHLTIEFRGASGTSIYVYDGDNIEQEVSATGVLVERYTYGPGVDEPLVGQRQPKIFYYEADGIGSVTSLTDPTGAVAATYTYDSFGNLTASTGSATNSFRYAGREFDSSTALYYNRARYYDQTTGRFLSEDPVGFSGADANLYRYAWSDPVLYTDPVGLAPQQGSCGSQPRGFTLSVRQSGQSYSDCISQNAKFYSAGGLFDLLTGLNIGTSGAGQLFAGNTFTSLYAAFAGSASDAGATLAGATPLFLQRGIGSVLTYGRRTSEVISLNLAGKGGLPQALSSSSGSATSVLGSISKVLSLGLDALQKAAIDAGLFGVEALECLPQ